VNLKDLTMKIKRIRTERQNAAEKAGTNFSEAHRGELIGYFKVLELICPDPEKE
jgi:hypothetical protein